MKIQDMTQRYRKFKRAWGMYYAFDTVTGNSVSLKTKDKAQANHLVVAMNQSSQQAALNLSLAKVYLRHSDPLVASRNWQNVIDEIIRTKSGENQIRWQVMAKSKWFDPLRHRLLIETQAEHLLHVLQCGKVAINVYLRRMHNFAIDMNWLPASVLPKRQWPAAWAEKRISLFSFAGQDFPLRTVEADEHQRQYPSCTVKLKYLSTSLAGRICSIDKIRDLLQTVFKVEFTCANDFRHRCDFVISQIFMSRHIRPWQSKLDDLSDKL